MPRTGEETPIPPTEEAIVLEEIRSGRIRVAPPLNEDERTFLRDLCLSDRTLRGTPTGRGDTSVPFVHSAWAPCEEGCCLTWVGTEHTRHALAGLQFLLAHLLGPGARATGHPRFPGFTCDHVLDGTVVVRAYDDALPTVVTVTANTAVELAVEPACASRPTTRGPARQRPANVVELRPRRA